MKCMYHLLMLCVLSVGLSADGFAEELTIFTEEWPPISFSQNGVPAGLSVDVVREILARVDMPDTIQVVPWARGWKIALTRPDTVLFTMTRTPERERLFTLIGPVAVGLTNCYAKKGAGLSIKTLEDAMQVKRIGVYRAAVEEQLLKDAGFTNLDPTTEPIHSAKKLMRGRIDLWCNANLTVGKILEEFGYTLDDVEKVLTIQENYLYIAFSRGTDIAVVEQWSEALQAIHADGSFAQMYKKWLPGEVGPTKVERLGVLYRR